MQSPKIISYGWCKKGTNLYGASNYPHSYIAILDRRCNFPKLWSLLSPWCRVCTKTIFILKGSFRDAEPTNTILWLVQEGYKPLPDLALGVQSTKMLSLGWCKKGYKPIRSFKLSAFMCRHTGPTMQFSENSRLPIVLVPCLHQNNIYIKR